jgi:hypothetical protein
VADDMLLEAPEGMDIKARDTRSEPATDEIDAVQPELRPEPEPEPESEAEPETGEPEGVTPSADWAHYDEDPESYSAPV